MSFNSGGTTLSAQFNLKSKQPIDGRYIVTTKEEYDSMKSIALYPGLSFVVTSDFVDDADNNITKGFYKVGLDGETIVKQEQFPEPLIVTVDVSENGSTGDASVGAAEIIDYYRKGASVFLVYNNPKDEATADKTCLCILNSCLDAVEGDSATATFVYRDAESTSDINIVVYEDKTTDLFTTPYARYDETVSVAVDQDFTSEQKRKARNNIGVGCFIITLAENQTELSEEDLINIQDNLESGNTVLLRDTSNKYFWLTHSTELNSFQFTNLEERLTGLTICSYTIAKDRQILYYEREYKHKVAININYQDPEVEDDLALVSDKTAPVIKANALIFGNDAICVQFKNYFATLTTSTTTNALFCGITTDSGNCEYFTISIDESGNASFTKQQLLTEVSPVLITGEQTLTIDEQLQVQKNLGIDTLIVTASQELDESGTATTGRYIASHSASEIYEHISNGGFVALDFIPLIAFSHIKIRLEFCGSTIMNEEPQLVYFINSGPLDGVASFLRITIDNNKICETGEEPWIRYDLVQTLTETQQTQAKENIAACGIRLITWEDDD